MKVVILAGGYGTRISEETDIRPKPMISIGNRPILWHIMKIYSSYGFNEFLVFLGYKGYYIKEYFANYFLHESDVTFDLGSNTTSILNSKSEPWKVTLIDTGIDTMTGSRIKKAQAYIGSDPFLLTYGDGLSNVNINSLIDFHNSHDQSLTVTAVQAEGRFGALEIGENSVISDFKEKPKGDGNWINGGFFVCNPNVFDFIGDGNEIVFEQDPLNELASNGQLAAYKHSGFWKPMDSLKDKMDLNAMWNSNNSPWKVW